MWRTGRESGSTSLGEAHRAVGTSKGRGSARACRGHLSGSLRRQRDARVASPLTRHGSTRSGNASVAPVTQIAVRHQPSPPCGGIPATPVFAWAGRAPRGVGGLPGQSALARVKPGPSVPCGTTSRRDMRARTLRAGVGTISAMIAYRAAPAERDPRCRTILRPANPRDFGLTSPRMHRRPGGARQPGHASAAEGGPATPRPRRAARSSHGT